jgi:hypothetical protein
MSEELLKEYQKNLPYLDDIELYHAAKKALYIIVVKHGRKLDTIKRVAIKNKVSASDLTDCVNLAIPQTFFAKRAEKAQKKHEASFFVPTEVVPVDDKDKHAGELALSKIRGILHKDKM